MVTHSEDNPCYFATNNPQAFQIFKVNDLHGNPIQIAAVVVWRVVDPARARRYFLKNYGMTFQAYCRGRRLGISFEQIAREKILMMLHSDTVINLTADSVTHL